MTAANVAAAARAGWAEAMPGVRIRDFQPGDGPAVARVALRGFDEFRSHYDDWNALTAGFGPMTSSGEMIVATVDDEVAGAVTYLGPGTPKKEIFPPEWSVVRLLVVDPAHRGRGIGRALMDECLRRAGRDRAPVLALNTAHVMRAAVALYEEMGFELRGEAPTVSGVAHVLYVKPLASHGSRASFTPGHRPPPAR